MRVSPRAKRNPSHRRYFSSIGEALAKEFARNEHDIVVSRDSELVKETCARIAEEFEVQTLGLDIDLTADGAEERLREELEQRGIEIEIRVNNAGRGERGSFHEIP